MVAAPKDTTSTGSLRSGPNAAGPKRTAPPRSPILSADASSSEIENKVFDGLIDYDENLHFRGRLATGWKVYEGAYFYVNQSISIPHLGRATAQQIVDFVKTAQKNQP